MIINIKDKILKIQPPKNEQKPITIKDLKNYLKQLPKSCDDIELLIKEEIRDDKNWTPVNALSFMSMGGRFDGNIDKDVRFMLYYLTPLRPSSS